MTKREFFWTTLLVLLLHVIMLSWISGVHAATVTFGWNYSRAALDITDGFKLYKGPSAGNTPTLVKSIAAGSATIHSESPILVRENFDKDPGAKYNVTKGSWKWVSETQGMKITGPEFMVIFEVPAGASNTFSYSFWPEKSTGTETIVYNYIKDEALAAYYELRFAGADGVRFSNWRKVYDMQFGGVEGAFALPRFAQCNIVAGQSNICTGFWINLIWMPGFYEASIYDQAAKKYDTVGGVDEKALNINKVEVIINQQEGWIDNIVIGGFMELRAVVDNIDPDAYYAMSSYNEFGESEKSLPVFYTTTEIPEEIKPLPGVSNLKIIKSGE